MKLSNFMLSISLLLSAGSAFAAGPANPAAPTFKNSSTVRPAITTQKSSAYEIASAADIPSNTGNTALILSGITGIPENFDFIIPFSQTNSRTGKVDTISQLCPANYQLKVFVQPRDYGTPIEFVNAGQTITNCAIASANAFAKLTQTTDSTGNPALGVSIIAYSYFSDSNSAHNANAWNNPLNRERQGLSNTNYCEVAAEQARKNNLQNSVKMQVNFQVSCIPNDEA